MERISLPVQRRTAKGKGAARKIRAGNKVPAIFYGPGTEPVMLTVGYSDLENFIKKGSSEQAILDLLIETENGTEKKMAMLKDLQTDPLKGTYLHADFYEISMEREITINVPIKLANTPVGVTKGGVLEQVRREIEITCRPDKIVESIELDISGLDIGETLHIKDIDMPEGVKSTEEGHLTVVLVAAPAAEEAKVEEEEGAEEAEETAKEETESE